MLPEVVDPTLARKKRKEIISNLRQNTKRLKDDDDTTVSLQDSDRPKTKYQNHYEPDIPMTKEQAAEWRKEARRKRNRESAAASRNKVRNRIAELEQEVQDWKDKYSTLLKRIEFLEQKARLAPTTCFSSDSTVPNLFPSNRQLCVSPCLTPTLSPSSEKTEDDTRLGFVDLHDSMDQLRVPLDLEERFETSQSQNVATDNGRSCSSSVSIKNTEKNAMSCTRADPLVVVSVPNEFHLNLEKTSRPAE